MFVNMPCKLVIRGEYFDIDAFIKQRKLSGFFMAYKGTPMYKSKPEGKKMPYSSISIQTSKADFNKLDKQIKYTIKYLKKNQKKLSLITQTKEIELALLDFGINLRIDHKKVAYQSDSFPNELLKIAGDLGLDIILSIYPINPNYLLEKRRRIKSNN